MTHTAATHIARIDREMQIRQTAIDNRINNCRKWRELAEKGMV